MVLLVLILVLWVLLGVMGLLLKGLAWLFVASLIGGCITLAWLLISRSRT